MKLAQKLTLAFLLVSLVATGLAVASVGVTTSIGFNSFIVDQREAAFLALAKSYYQEHGTWQGLDEALRENGLLPPDAKPGSKSPDPQPFALVDINREVIIPSGDYQAGTKIQKGILEKGIQIELGGLRVGTMLMNGQKITRSAIEQKYIESVNRSLLVAALGGAMLALLIGFFLARSLTRPLRALNTATHQVASGKLEQKVPVTSKDEIGELAESFNQMSADLAKANRSRKQMTADIAHDLRNPLTVLGGYLESLKDGKLKPSTERYQTMQAEVTLLQKLVDDLRILSLADAGELMLHFQPVNPYEILARVRAAYMQQAQAKGVELEVITRDVVKDMELDPERLEQVLGNLVSNALRYTSEGGTIQLSASEGQTCVIIRVTDTGCGIHPSDLPYIFERSYRGDPSRSGEESGLGLAISRSIVELHGGKITVQSELGKGSEFQIQIPYSTRR
jgi:signal transduction histidine kinase